MRVDSQNEITELLREWNKGDEGALKELVSLIYSELRLQAKNCLSRERPDHTLEPTALIHEVYIRLAKRQNVDWQNRTHFFNVAAKLMRNILVDHARSRNTIKRGSGSTKISLDEAIALPQKQEVDLQVLDEALTRLETLDPQKSRIVELRFFAGLSIEETAEALKISVPTVVRQWRIAKAWLYEEINRNAIWDYESITKTRKSSL